MMKRNDQWSRGTSEIRRNWKNTSGMAPIRIIQSGRSGESEGWSEWSKTQLFLCCPPPRGFPEQHPRLRLQRVIGAAAANRFFIFFHGNNADRSADGWDQSLCTFASDQPTSRLVSGGGSRTNDGEKWEEKWLRECGGNIAIDRRDGEGGGGDVEVNGPPSPLPHSRLSFLFCSSFFS